MKTCICVLFLTAISFLNAQEVVKSTVTPSITIILTGDIQPGVSGDSSYKYDRFLRKKGFDYPFKKVTGFFNKADIVIGNLEGALTNSKEKRKKRFTFKNLPVFAVSLKKAGFDVVTLANNHSFDYGEKGLLETIKVLKEENIMTVGAGKDENEAYKPAIIRKNGIVVGVLSFSDIVSGNIAAVNRPGVSWASSFLLPKVIKSTKERVDILLVTFHWGEELAEEPNERQKKLAYLAVDSGADVVFGHHPHCIQPMEEYKNSLIFYSLGELVFDRQKREQEIVELIVKKIDDKTVFDYEIIPIVILNNQPNFIK
ncbi:MAG: CapA family protein [Elusimicrobia bacterium]|nr:CapA family protein [Elusimicrobiota bacterium]